MVGPAASSVAIASAAWDIPGLETHDLLEYALRNLPRGPAAAAEAPGFDPGQLLGTVIGAAVARAGLGALEAGDPFALILVGEGTAAAAGLRRPPWTLRDALVAPWPAGHARALPYLVKPDSYSALVHGFKAIGRGESQRVLVAGLLDSAWGAGAGTARHAAPRGACAVLLEADASLAARPLGRSRLNLVAHAAGRTEALDCWDVLALLQRHADKTLYVGANSALLPALGVVTDLRLRHVVDLAAHVPPRSSCLCLLQLISYFERHGAGDTTDELGAVLTDDGIGDRPAGVLVVAANGAPPDVHVND